ncbi:hypothetical protein EM20IM_00515 [Candidatus Methylacidiphilum infernorum]|uniref:Uncharacterized protein n=1 Tax=Candidatus Methylacidiphilum infernorum TaxID=511746 RepID=A0ABX7PVN6_9BACT|nr:hypothetical protein [Candidatus Methylacidiphilum infernorum]QSR86890.1 hypothetical protein EM20IM_00515 [Candidatus Methylacidiphilum infernorum]
MVGNPKWPPQGDDNDKNIIRQLLYLFALFFFLALLRVVMGMMIGLRFWMGE